MSLTKDKTVTVIGAGLAGLSPAFDLHVAAMRPWFSVPERLHYHRGHTWAKPLGDGVVRVGVDDFAQRLLGAPKELRLPPAGAKVEQGAPGWSIQVDGEALDVLSPVGGEVVPANPDALRKTRATYVVSDAAIDDLVSFSSYVAARGGMAAVAFPNVLGDVMDTPANGESLERLQARLATAGIKVVGTPANAFLEIQDIKDTHRMAPETFRLDPIPNADFDTDSGRFSCAGREGHTLHDCWNMACPAKRRPPVSTSDVGSP